MAGFLKGKIKFRTLERLHFLICSATFGCIFVFLHIILRKNLKILSQKTSHKNRISTGRAYPSLPDTGSRERERYFTQPARKWIIESLMLLCVYFVRNTYVFYCTVIYYTVLLLNGNRGFANWGNSCDILVQLDHNISSESQDVER